MSVTIQLRGDLAANWTADNPVLHQREPGIETDTGRIKFGDGATAWTSLAYWSGGSGALPESGGTMTGWLAPAVVALTFASTIAVNAALGNVFAVTLTASTGTLGTPANPVDGQAIRVRVIQDGTGSRTLAYSSAWDFGTAGSPTLSTAANAVDYLVGEYNAVKSKWCVSAALGY